MFEGGSDSVKGRPAAVAAGIANRNADDRPVVSSDLIESGRALHDAEVSLARTVGGLDSRRGVEA